MSWQQKSQHIDMKLAMHVVTLHDPETGAEQKLQFNLGHELSSCPHCGHVREAGMDIDQLEPKEHIQKQIDELNRIHGKVKSYKDRHRIPVRK